MALEEVGPKTLELQRAESVVSKWLMMIWIERPSWMKSMPSKEDVDQLVNLIAAELERKPK